MMVRSSFHPLTCCFAHLLLTDFIHFCKAGQIGASGPKDRRVACVALYSARGLKPNEELFVHYGDAMARDYDVGNPAPELFKYEIDESELPAHWLPLGEHWGHFAHIFHVLTCCT